MAQNIRLTDGASSILDLSPWPFRGSYDPDISEDVEGQGGGREGISIVYRASHHINASY